MWSSIYLLESLVSVSISRANCKEIAQWLLSVVEHISKGGWTYVKQTILSNTDLSQKRQSSHFKNVFILTVDVKETSSSFKYDRDKLHLTL